MKIKFQRIENSFPKLVLSFVFLFTTLAIAGCSGNDKPDFRLAASWSSGPDTLILKADGTFQKTLTGAIVPNSTIVNESGKWSVKDNKLIMKNNQSGAVSNFRYQLNDKGDQLKLTLDSPLNPNELTVTYSK